MIVDAMSALLALPGLWATSGMIWAMVDHGGFPLD
jgi:hypothetical protein